MKAKPQQAVRQRQAVWRATRQEVRSEVSRVLRDIERGHVNQIDFAKLNNFCATTLMLLARVEQGAWEASKRDAEISALLRDEVEDIEDTEDEA